MATRLSSEGIANGIAYLKEEHQCKVRAVASIAKFYSEVASRNGHKHAAEYWEAVSYVCAYGLRTNKRHRIYE